MTDTADPGDLVTMAAGLLRRDRVAAGVWPRATAVLTRQAIELALSHLWQLRAPGLQWTSARCQLLCLREFLQDEDLAERTASTWWGLSRALHQHPYELVPTRDELAAWVAVARDLAGAVAARGTPAG